MSIYLCQWKTIVFHGRFISRLITQTKPNASVTMISRFIVIWNHRGWLSVELILYFSCYTTHVFECSLDDILSLPLMYKCNSTQRSIFLLSLPLRPLCFILAITLRKKYHVGPSTQSLFSLPVHHRTLDLGGEPQLDQTRQISKAWEWPTCRSLFIWVL